jgi:hypothetical protein
MQNLPGEAMNLSIVKEYGKAIRANLAHFPALEYLVQVLLARTTFMTASVSMVFTTASEHQEDINRSMLHSFGQK